MKILSVVDEEGGEMELSMQLQRCVQADGAIICEPSGNKIINAHMGFVFFEIEVN